MWGDTLLPLPLSRNGLTHQGLDLWTDLCYCSFSVGMFFVQWVGWVGVQVCRFVHPVPREDPSLLGLELCPSTPSFRPSQQSRKSQHAHWSLPCLVSCASGVCPGHAQPC